MTRRSSLSVAFIDRRPVSAARALAAIDPGDAGALLETVPSRFAARAMSHMDAGPASSVIGRMEAVSAAAILRELEYPDAAMILRHLSSETQHQILDQLPKKLRRDFGTSLSFPDDTVGAHMATTIMTAGAATSVAEALKLIRRSPANAGEIIFVLDNSKKMAGMVRAASLLRHRETVPVGEIMEEAPVSLSSRARLEIVAELAVWDTMAHLPVTDRQKRVIGVLSRKAMRQAMEHRAVESGTPQISIVAAMTEAFFAGTYGLVRLLTDIQPGPDTSRAEGDRQ